MAKVLYARVSTTEQNLDRQLNPDENYTKIFSEKISGATTNRPQLQEMLDWIREGDTVDVHEISRLARNLIDLLEIVKIITEEKHATIHFIKENLTFTADSSNPFDELTLKLLGTFAEFERQMIKTRQAEGIKKKKEKSNYHDTPRKKKLSDSQIEIIRQECTVRSANITEIAKRYKVTRGTIYNILKA